LRTSRLRYLLYLSLSSLERGTNSFPQKPGRKLFAAAGEPKELWIIPGADHGGTFVSAGSMYGAKGGEFFDKNLI